MVALSDMNCFFAGISQLDNPHLRGRPVAVTNGARGTCIITSSYEARAFGVKTGMRMAEARALCPGLVQVPSQPHRYAEVSSRIMDALQEISPDIEIFSVDEAFINLTSCQTLYRNDPHAIGRLIKETVFRVSGLHCSVGISGDKTTAKWAAKRMKPNGLTIIEPWNAQETLSKVPVTDLCGIKGGIGGYLAARGVFVCGDMQKLPISELSRRFGNLGRRIWYMAQGQDPDPLHQTVSDPKTIGHGKVIPPRTTDRRVLEVFLIHMAMKVGRRLRKHNFTAQSFAIGVATHGQGWISEKYKLADPTDDGYRINELCSALLDHAYRGQPCWQIHVRALDPQPKALQGDMFRRADARRDRINTVVDRINLKFGSSAIMPAPLLGRSDMPDVIAPSWKPTGHRETIGY